MCFVSQLRPLSAHLSDRLIVNSFQLLSVTSYTIKTPSKSALVSQDGQNVFLNAIKAIHHGRAGFSATRKQVSVKQIRSISHYIDADHFLSLVDAHPQDPFAALFPDMSAYINVHGMRRSGNHGAHSPLPAGASRVIAGGASRDELRRILSHLKWDLNITEN